MPIINEKNQLFTVMVVFEVDPEYQHALIEGITEQVTQHFKGNSGFVSASFHVSEDGRKVVNYAQWRSREAWETITSDESKTAVIVETIERCGVKSFYNEVIRVERVIEN
ncbi:antibiotic biosynthesis monooxygenase family protein [Salibacterium halotolerans]|uniref:Antibiotic biosynthesis monooxygenase n=1 Tax=Salibacterium halotolerans TaxID=1884432 RepID=A0A1I5YBY6_9BACI|nr:antibiotic biosynthesis monooxygenase [Salibacterium halotolerans]SFQ41407.1 Antibiotic biosynthesis monooxygenase [Salibacterium halotolerans]